MEKSYLYRRHNVYWVRVRVPDKVRNIVGKAQLSKNLSTTDLSEANRKKHIVIAELKQIIHLAEQKLDGTFASLSKEDQIRELALEFRPSPEDNSEDLDFILTDIIEHKVSELYGEKESNAIIEPIDVSLIWIKSSILSPPLDDLTLKLFLKLIPVDNPGL